jgi:hypothetical protein
MTIKSLSEFLCPACQLPWLPFAPGLSCPRCGQPTDASDVSAIVSETLESARFNKRLYGKIALDFWIPHRLGDRYLEWSFAALDAAERNPASSAEDVAVSALVTLDLEEFGAYRQHVFSFLVAAIEAYRTDVAAHPETWQKLPEPEKPFFGRKIIEE